MRTLHSCFVLGLLVSSSAGCAALQSAGDSVRQTVTMFRPSNGDYWDPAEEEDEGWVVEAGKEARGDRALEKINDPIREWTMSPKARSIERNLGFE